MDWGQGLKAQPAGDVKVFISPKGKTLYSKINVEKYVGEVLEADDVKWPSWLPKNWAITKRAKGSGELIRCYITPEGDRYFDQKKDVEAFIRGEGKKQRKPG